MSDIHDKTLENNMTFRKRLTLVGNVMMTVLTVGALILVLWL